MIRRAASIVSLALMLAGCVAIWGRPYEIEAERSDSVVIKYDSTFISLDKVEKVAQASCGSKHAVAQGSDTSFWGLTTVTFACETPQR